MLPSELMITPEPSSEPALAVTVIETTLGCTAAATLASVSVGLVPPLTAVPLATVAVGVAGSRCSAISAPANPDPSATASTTAAAATIRPVPRRPPRGAAGEGIGGSVGGSADGSGGSGAVAVLGADHQGEVAVSSSACSAEGPADGSAAGPAGGSGDGRSGGVGVGCQVRSSSLMVRDSSPRLPGP